LWRSRWNVDWQGKPKFSKKAFITYCYTILREEVKVGVKEVDFQRHVRAMFFIA
jgi:hypothetical protein